MKLKIIGLQLLIEDAETLQARDSNIQHALAEIACCDTCDLIVLPELFSVGYGRGVFEHLAVTSDCVAGDLLQEMRRAARRKQVHLAFGFPERDGGHYYNSVAIINDRGELVDLYRKAHLPQFEQTQEIEQTQESSYFTPGDRLVSFDVNGIRIGLAICYDIRFPELTRCLTIDHEIDLLINPTGFFADETILSWHPFIVTRAIENQIYVLSVNRAGVNNGYSIFCSPMMDWQQNSKVLGTDEAQIVAFVDKDVITAVRRKYGYRQAINRNTLGGKV